MRKCDWCKKMILVKELFAVNALSEIIEIFVQKIIQAAKRVRSAGKIYQKSYRQGKSVAAYGIRF